MHKIDAFKSNLTKVDIERAKAEIKVELTSKIEELETEFLKKLQTAKKYSDRTIIKLKNSYNEENQKLKQLIKELYDEINDFKVQIGSQEYKLELYKEKIISFEKEKKLQTDHADLMKLLTQKLNNVLESMNKRLKNN